MTDGRDALMGAGFEESTSGGGGIPVLRARGVFAGMDVNTKESKDVDPNTGKPKQYKQVAHNIADLEVLEVKEGTEFPFNSLEFFMSAATKEGTAYHAWVDSVKLALPNVDWDAVEDTGALDEEGDAIMQKVWGSYAKIYDDLLDGNAVEIDRTGTIPGRRMEKGEWVDKAIPVWKVVFVGGASSAAPAATPVEAAIALVGSSSNFNEFIGAVPGNTIIGQDAAFLMELASGAEAWLAAQAEAGTLVVAGDWYTVA